MVTMGTQFATFSVHLSCFSGSLASCASVHNSFLQVQVFDIRTAEISGQDFHERTMEIHGQDFISEQISANKCVEFLNEKHITSLIWTDRKNFQNNCKLQYISIPESLVTIPSFYFQDKQTRHMLNPKYWSRLKPNWVLGMPLFLPIFFLSCLLSPTITVVF